MSAILSYHNDPAIKAKYVRRFAKHRRADQVVQGGGYNQPTGNGCFIGCTLEEYSHQNFALKLGWLVGLAEAIFERLPAAEAPQFGTDLLDAVPVGVDLEPVHHLLAVRRLNRVMLSPGAVTDGRVMFVLSEVRAGHNAEINRRPYNWSAAVRLLNWAKCSGAHAACPAIRAAEFSIPPVANRNVTMSAIYAAKLTSVQQERDELLETLRGLGE